VRGWPRTMNHPPFNSLRHVRIQSIQETSFCSHICRLWLLSPPIAVIFYMSSRPSETETVKVLTVKFISPYLLTMLH
jgi:hypothetical protein